MPDIINQHDLSMMYANSIVLYKNKPVLVLTFGRDNSAHILDLLTQRDKVVPFSLEEFKAPTRRLGMVNIDANAVYVVRNPVRKYSVGLNSGNIDVQPIGGCNYAIPFRSLQQSILGLRNIALADCMLNKYPTFGEAVQKARAVGGAVAFDKQFAVDRNLSIFYKTEYVGECDRNSDDTDQIQFNKGYKHLGLLFKENYTNSIQRVT